MSNPEKPRLKYPMRLSTAMWPVAAMVLFSPPGASAQDGYPDQSLDEAYWSAGVSFGGEGLALHLEAHLLAPASPQNGNDLRATGIEFVLGLPRHEVAGGGKRFGVNVGANVRYTGRSGVSAAVGYRKFVLTPAPDARSGFERAWLIGLATELYPVPIRASGMVGIGKRLDACATDCAAAPWQAFVPWPQLQAYLRHSRGFEWSSSGSGLFFFF